MALKVKMRWFRRSISAILAFVLVFTTAFSTLTIVSSAVAPTSYTDVVANSTATVNITTGGSSQYFRFVPTESGSYTFYSSNASSDTYGALLDSYGSTLLSNDDGGVDRNFSITYDCVAGETYYIQAFFYSSSTTGSYTLNIQANFTLTPSTPNPPVVGNAIVTTPGANTYSLFNSGRTGVGYASIGSSWSESTDPNVDETSFTNGGYDIYSNSRAYPFARLGLSFVIDSNVTEQARLTVYTYDVDESNGSERDYIYLVDNTLGTSTKLDGYLSGMDQEWNTTTFIIPPSYFTTGHEYYFQIETTGDGGYHTFTRTVSIQLTTDGEVVPPATPIITEHSFSASINNFGLISTSLFLKTSEDVDYTFEYSASINSYQLGSYFVPTTTITPSGMDLSIDFELESNAPTGTYQIDVIIKDTSGNVITTYSTIAGYSYSAVSYDANGGSNNLPFDYNEYTIGDTVTVLFDYIPSRSGYTFLGWSTDSYATEPEFTENGNTTFTMGGSDVKLYAVWEEIEAPTEVPSETPSETPSEPPVNPPSTPADVWDGSIASDFGGGSGTESDPYLIYTSSQLAYLRQMTNYGYSYSGVYFKLMNDLDLNNIAWTPIGYSESCAFGGRFDGNYHTISNMTINGSYQFVGLFGVIDSAHIANLALTSVNINTTLSNNYSAVGGLSGIASTSSTIDTCSVSGTLIAYNTSSSYAMEIGGLVANIGGNITITNCYTNVTIYGSTNGYNTYAGGLIGITDSNVSGTCVIENCYSIADVTAITTASSKYATAGGLIGDMWSNLTLRNCFATGSVSASSSYGSSHIGAILGYRNSGSFSTSNCYYGNSNTYSSYSGIYSTDNANFASEDWITSNLGWDFENIWTFDTSAGYIYPVHSQFVKINHQASEWIYDVEPTCLTGGHRYNVCTICGEILVSEDVPALQHNFVVIEESPATCTTDGYVIMTCQRAGCGYSKHQIIYASGHNFGSDNICDECGFELVVHEHEYTETVVDATCTQIGYTIHICECGHEYRDNFVDQRGHSWDEGVVSTPKTCTTVGVMVRTCTVCQASYETEIPAGHDWSEDIVVEATCTTDGSITHTCNACGEGETVIIPAAHTWDEGTVITEATCTEAGLKACTCTVCGEYAEIEIPVLGHTFVDGFCTRCGAGITDIVAPNTDHPQYGMYFEIDDILSNYGPELINEYGVLLDFNQDANIKKVAVFLTQEGTMWRRCIACVGDNITYATYVPYLSYDETIHYTGLNSDWINIFRLSENNDGIWCYSNYTTIGVNLEDAYGNLLLSLYDIGQAGAKTRVFDDLDEMIQWLKEPDGCIYHTEGEWTVESYATCGADGLKYTYCTECGIRIEEILPATGEHEISDWIIDIYPTATASGSRHKECIVCNTVMETDIMDMLATLKIEDVVARPGSIVSVTMDIQNNPGIIGAALTFTFDPSLTLVSATAGGAWSMLNLTTPGNYYSPCTFVWDGVNVSDYSNGTIITLTFELPEWADIGSVYEISAYYEFGNMINAEFENVDVVIESGSITVGELMGDVNNDGIVDVADVISLRRYMSSGYDVTIDLVQADMNNDGVITMADIILLRRYITNGAI